MVLTSEGADECLVGYPWYKIAKMFNAMHVIPGEDAVGGPNAWVDIYGMLALSELRFYGEPMREVLAEARPKV